MEVHLEVEVTMEAMEVTREIITDHAKRKTKRKKKKIEEIVLRLEYFINKIDMKISNFDILIGFGIFDLRIFYRLTNLYAKIRLIVDKTDNNRRKSTNICQKKKKIGFLSKGHLS